MFEKALGYGLGDNDKTTNTDLFQKGTIALIGGIFFTKPYLLSTKKLNTS